MKSNREIAYSKIDTIPKSSGYRAIIPSTVICMRIKGMTPLYICIVLTELGATPLR